MSKKAKVLILGANFAGLTMARYVHKLAQDAVDITVIDRKNYVNFIPNIPIEVFNNHNPADTMEFPFHHHLKKDGTHFIQADVTRIDADKKTVHYTPVERDGADEETITYDYVVIALGCRLAYDKIEGFAEYGHTFSDTFYGNEIRNYLHHDYQGGPVVIGADYFHQGYSPKTPKVPKAVAACEGPPVELAFSLADWMTKRGFGGAKDITLFTPGEIMVEDAGETILGQLMPMLKDMGYGYKNNTQGIKRLTKEGIEFNDGSQLEAELKIVFPDWVAHDFLKDQPFSDDQGFVITDWHMRNPDYPELFCVGDAAAVTLPKLGALGHLEVDVAAKVLTNEILGKDDPVEPVSPMVLCYGDMGDNKGFYMHTNEWWGGDKHILKMGYTPYLMKISFKELYRLSGGDVPSWGLPLSELLGEHSPL